MHTLIVANGAPNDLPLASRLPAANLIVVADGGAVNARRLGLQPDVLVGDLDSLALEEVARLRSAGTELVIHPTDKDATDLELALRYAVDCDADRITVIGALGSRLDQTLANVFLLTLPAFSGVVLKLLGNGWEAFAVRNAARVEGMAGDTVSLIPLTPEVTGVTTTGLAWPLDHATLVFGPSLGISNRMTEAMARISVGDGILLIVHSGPLESTDVRREA